MTDGHDTHDDAHTGWQQRYAESERIWSGRVNARLAEVTDGFLYVSVLDVSGHVFHLLPNQSRPDNSVGSLRGGQAGIVPVRVAYGLAEAQGTSNLAFTVDASSLGKSKVIVLYSKAPLFATLREISEPAADYAQALADLVTSGTAAVATLDSRILTTAQP